MPIANKAKAREESTTIHEVKRVQVLANWMEQKEKLKKRFGLTYAELAFKKGEREEMLGRLQIKLGKTREELDAIIAAL